MPNVSFDVITARVGNSVSIERRISFCRVRACTHNESLDVRAVRASTHPTCLLDYLTENTLKVLSRFLVYGNRRCVRLDYVD
jgi:hypothetical protein